MHKLLIQPPHRKISFNANTSWDWNNALENCKIIEGKVHNSFIKKKLSQTLCGKHAFIFLIAVDQFCIVQEKYI